MRCRFGPTLDKSVGTCDALYALRLRDKLGEGEKKKGLASLFLNGYSEILGGVDGRGAAVSMLAHGCSSSVVMCRLEELDYA